MVAVAKKTKKVTKGKKGAKKTPKKSPVKKSGEKRQGAWKSGKESLAWKRTKESGELLTPRQQEVLRLTSLGCAVREIAVLTGLAVSTVDNHKAAGMKALGLTKATLLVRKLIEMKVTKADEKLTPKEIKALGGDFVDGWNRT